MLNVKKIETLQHTKSVGGLQFARTRVASRVSAGCESLEGLVRICNKGCQSPARAALHVQGRSFALQRCGLVQVVFRNHRRESRVQGTPINIDEDSSISHSRTVKV